MNKRLILLILAIFILAGCQNQAVVNNSVNLKIDNKNPVLADTATTTPKTTPVINDPGTNKIQPKVNTTVTPPSLPQTLDYPVTFVSQAPYAVWDQLHGEACEEAAMIMAVKYFKQQPLNSHLMEQTILDLIKWEEQNNYQVDLTAQEMVDILTSYFHQPAKLVTEVTVERIKQELVAGNLIVVPAAGRLLGNPYFQNPGPIYHALVIRGYNQTEFITNDPGTKRGEGFKYSYQTLINAVHNWNHQLAEGGMTDAEMAQGQKVMIVVGKN